jgi:hypothetical protein
MIPSSPAGGAPVQHALACADKQRHHHPTWLAVRASPPPGPTAERHPFPGLAAGRPEASASTPCLHRYGSAIVEVSILHLVIGLIQMLICVMCWLVLLLHELVLDFWVCKFSGRGVVLCGCFFLADKQNILHCCCEIGKLCLDIYICMSQIFCTGVGLNNVYIYIHYCSTFWWLAWLPAFQVIR